MFQTIKYLVVNILALSSLFFAVSSCKKPDNTNRIRPVSNHVFIEKESTEQEGERTGTYYNIKKDGQQWVYPALKEMKINTSVYSNTGDKYYGITIDNGFTRNDTIFYDKLVFGIGQIRPQKSIYRVYLDYADATYYTGNEFVRKTMNFSSSAFLQSTIEILSMTDTRMKLKIDLTTREEAHTFKGIVEFDLE